MAPATVCVVCQVREIAPHKMLCSVCKPNVLNELLEERFELQASLPSVERTEALVKLDNYLREATLNRRQPASV